MKSIPMNSVSDTTMLREAVELVNKDFTTTFGSSSFCMRSFLNQTLDF